MYLPKKDLTLEQPIEKSKARQRIAECFKIAQSEIYQNVHIPEQLAKYGVSLLSDGGIVRFNVDKPKIFLTGLTLL